MKYSPSTRGFYDEAIHTVIPEDARDVSRDWHFRLLDLQSEGYEIVPDENGDPIAIPPAGPTLEQIKLGLTAAVQGHMDAAAQALGYDGIASAVTYAEEPAVPKFQAEGQAFRAWRSMVWAACYAIVADVESGNRPLPTAEELIAELPALPQ